MGGPKEGGKSKDRSIADSSKSLIFLRKITTFTTSRDLVYSQKRRSYPVGKRLERGMQESCPKIGSWTLFDINFGAQKRSKNSLDRRSFDVMILSFFECVRSLRN